MTWSYSQNPSTSQRDEVRFKIGDTLAVDPLIQDEEIDYLLSTEGSVIEAAVAACISIAARFSREADKSVAELRVSKSQKSKQYLELADRLRRQIGVLAIPYAGGITVTDTSSYEQDSNSTQPAFRRGMMVNHVR